MWPFKNKNRAPLTYEEEHNKAFNIYKKAAQIGVWSGALNVLGLLIAILQNTQSGDFNLFLCYGSLDFVAKLLIGAKLISTTPWYYVIIVALAIAISSGFILLSVYATQGKKICLLLLVILYFVDMCFLIPITLMGMESIANICLSAAIHTIIFGFILIALYQYFNIIKIAIKHNIIKEEGGTK